MAGSNAKSSAATGRAGNEFVITRTFDAPRELVFKAWTDAERLARWWGPKEFTWVSGKVDLRPGGMFHYCMRSPNGQEMWGKFVYREVAKPERIVFVNSFSDEKGGTVRAPFNANWPLEILNTLTLTENEGRTKLTLRGYPTGATEAERKTFEEAFKSMEQGFGGTFDQLAGYLRKTSEEARVPRKTSFIAEAGKPTIVMKRVFDAPRKLVFEAWTNPEHVSRWMLGPSGWTMPVCEIDLRPGGAWHFVWQHSKGEKMEMRGVYREIVPPERLVATESWGGDWPETVNTLTLAEEDGKTTITQTMLFPSVEARDRAAKSGMEEGVEPSFNRLADVLATMAASGKAAPDLLMTRVLDAPRERVFEAWSKPERLSRWFGPKGFTMPTCEMDFQTGGVFRFVLRGPDGKDYPFDGNYLEIVEPERIAFNGILHNEAGHDVRTTVTFTDQEGKTRLTVHQKYAFESDATRGAPEGWRQTLDHLAEHLARA